MAFSADGRERLSNGRSFDYNGKILLSTGDALVRSQQPAADDRGWDDVGRHDFLYASCSLEMYRMQYSVTGYHANCLDNLRAALRELGLELDSLPTAFNFFMNVEILADGRLKILPPKCRKGDSMVCAPKWTWPSRCRRARPLRATTVRPDRSHLKSAERQLVPADVKQLYRR